MKSRLVLCFFLLSSGHAYAEKQNASEFANPQLSIKNPPVQRSYQWLSKLSLEPYQPRGQGSLANVDQTLLPAVEFGFLKPLSYSTLWGSSLKFAFMQQSVNAAKLSSTFVSLRPQLRLNTRITNWYSVFAGELGNGELLQTANQSPSRWTKSSTFDGLDLGFSRTIEDSYAVEFLFTINQRRGSADDWQLSSESINAGLEYRW